MWPCLCASVSLAALGEQERLHVSHKQKLFLTCSLDNLKDESALQLFHEKAIWELLTILYVIEADTTSLAQVSRRSMRSTFLNILKPHLVQVLAQCTVTAFFILIT